MPFFSVVIPLYNKELFIQNTLTSVLKQSFQDFEVIVINDGSTDRSLNIVKSFKNERIKLFTIENQGVSYARNFGFEKANAELIAFLDADDIWLPNHLETLQKLYNDFSEANVFCTRYNIKLNTSFDKKIHLNEVSSNFRGIITNYFKSSIIDAILITGNSAISKSILNKSGLFDTQMRSGQDTDLWTRIAFYGKIAIDNKATMTYIKNENSISNSNFVKDRVKFLSKYKSIEKENYDFKRYMDINRFAIALERKMNGDIESFETIIKEIDYSNLNSKQKTILKLPSPILKKLKQLQVFLIKNKVYLSAFR